MYLHPYVHELPKIKKQNRKAKYSLPDFYPSAEVHVHIQALYQVQMFMVTCNKITSNFSVETK